jgi:hypothetical protein
MATLTDEQTAEILANKNELLKLVPKHGSAYGDIFKANYEFYLVIHGLSRKLSASKSRAIRMGFDHNLKLTHVVEQWFEQKGRCAKTKQLLCFEQGSQEDKNPYAVSIDRIHNNLGYTKGNIRLLTHWANNAKSTWTDEFFDSMVNSAAKELLIES